MTHLVIVHEEYLTRVYRAPRCSGAYAWKIFVYLASIIIPLIICAVTQGMWKKTNTYLEQPKIEFSRKCFFLLANPSKSEEYYFWSSFQYLNDADSSRLVMPIIESRADDHNNDGITDEINIDVSLKLPNASLQVTYVFYYMKFKVYLDYRSVFELDAPIMGTIDRSFPSEEAYVMGDLQFLQKTTLPAFGNYDLTDKNPSDNATEFSNGTSTFSIDDTLVQLFPLELIHQNQRRNYTLDILAKSEYLSPYINKDSTEFSFHFTFNCRAQILTYRTTAMELLKWFWLQYFSIFIMMKLMLRILSSFLYENQILPTLVTNSHRPKYE